VTASRTLGEKAGVAPSWPLIQQVCCPKNISVDFILCLWTLELAVSDLELSDSMMTFRCRNFLNIFSGKRLKLDKNMIQLHFNFFIHNLELACDELYLVRLSFIVISSYWSNSFPDLHCFLEKSRHLSLKKKHANLLVKAKGSFSFVIFERFCWF
jgi:hypothetical protein